MENYFDQSNQNIMDLKKVLIITYYWPPAGGGGVQRWLKFTKYLRQFGWEPIIFTVDQGEVPVEDNSLIKEIPENITTLRVPIWEPYDLYKKFTGRTKGEKVYSGFITEGKKERFSQKLSVFIRGNFFIPDARMFWIRPSIRFLRKFLRENQVDAIISTGPPHSTHRIALKLRKKFNIPWIADFRDPWTNIDFYDQLNLTKWADYQHRKQEKEVLNTADKIVTVSWSWAEDFKAICDREIEVITNGFDPEDFHQNPNHLDKEFSICHIGSMNKDRNPRLLWKVLTTLIQEIPSLKENLKIRLIGQVDFSILESIEDCGLTSFLEKLDFIPHQQVIRYLQKSQLLLLPINNTPNSAGILPGKLYEYLAAKRPILAIGPPNKDAGKVITSTKGGSIHDYDDFEGLKQKVTSYFESYLKGELSVIGSEKDLYSRKLLAKKYAELLSGIT